MNIFAIFEGWVKGRYKHKCVRVYIHNRVRIGETETVYRGCAIRENSIWRRAHGLLGNCLKH